MSPELTNGDSLPTFRLPEVIDVELAKKTLAGLPQAYLVESLFAVDHQSFVSGADSLAFLALNVFYANSLSGLLSNDEANQHRVFVEEKPETPGEQEALLLAKLQGSVNWLAWKLLNSSDIPDDVKAKFGVDGPDEHLEGVKYDNAVGSLNRWANKNPEVANKPLALSTEDEKQIESVCDKLTKLVEFYNSQQPLVAVYKVVFPEGYTPPEDGYMDLKTFELLSEYDIDMRRYSVVAGLLDLLGQEELVYNIRRDIGITDPQNL